MIKVSTIIDDKGARAFVVDLGAQITNLRDLNQALGERFVEELQTHWRAKDQKPNKLGSPRRAHIWAKAASGAAVADVSDSGVTVAVQGEAGQNIRIHVFGGTIVPKVADKLTIPLVREAHNMRVAEYEAQSGNELFTFGRRRALFEKVDGGGSESVAGNDMGRTRAPNVPWRPGTMLNNRAVIGRGNVIPLAKRQQLRAVYALVDEATITADPTALPPEADLLAALQEEAEDWLAVAGEGGAR